MRGPKRPLHVATNRWRPLGAPCCRSGVAAFIPVPSAEVPERACGGPHRHDTNSELNGRRKRQRQTMHVGSISDRLDPLSADTPPRITLLPWHTVASPAKRSTSTPRASAATQTCARRPLPRKALISAVAPSGCRYARAVGAPAVGPQIYDLSSIERSTALPAGRLLPSYAVDVTGLAAELGIHSGSPPAVLDSHSGRVQSPSGSVVCPTSIR